MRVSTLLSAAAAVGAAAQDASGPLTGSLGNATVVVNNPPGSVYVATLPDTAFDKAAYPGGGNAKGQIRAQARPNGIGVTFDVQFSNLPKEGGPFTYHIHASPVPADGNCTATGGHLDPFKRNDDPACESSLQQTCQVGDLSGKHGKITSDPFNTSYHDLFASTLPGNAAFFGNLSFVLHYPNKTRITCANFQLQQTGSSGSSNGTTETPTPTGSSGSGGTASSSSATSQPYVTAGAAANVVATGGIFAAVLAVML